MALEKLTSNQHSLIKQAQKLHQSKHRKSLNLLLVESLHPIEEALNANLIATHLFVLLDQESKYQKLIQQFKHVYLITEDLMSKIATTDTPPEIIAVFEKPAPQKTDLNCNTLVLCNPQDPGNAGTQIRSAVAFGFKQVIILGDSTLDLYQPKVIRASVGLVFRLNIQVVENIKALSSQFKEHTFYALEAGQGESYLSTQYRQPLLLLAGNEAHGFNGLNIEETQINWLNIPTTDETESLNVATASSIVMAQIYATKASAL